MIPEEFINKRVSFDFCKMKLVFALSQSLFSSYDVDTGTRLLLKTLKQTVDFSRVRRVLDLGCGTGVIGIVLGKCFPHLKVTAQDRDALAVAFSEYNARENGLSPSTFRAIGGIAYEGIAAGIAEETTLVKANEYPEGGKESIEIARGVFDLIVSNLPAKAGYPVLEEMISRAVYHLTDHGILATVVVNNLAERIEGFLSNNFLILNKKTGKKHTVFVSKMNKVCQISETKRTPGLGRYIREHVRFNFHGKGYELSTAFGLGNFDSMDYITELVIKILELSESLFRESHGMHYSGSFSGTSTSGTSTNRSSVNRGKRLLVWNPGQGYIPICSTVQRYLSRKDEKTNGIILAGRDRLALLVSKTNLVKNNILKPEEIAMLHLPFLSSSIEEIAGFHDNNCFQTAVFLLEEASYYSSESFANYLRGILKNKDFILAGRSTIIARLLKNKSTLKGLKVFYDKKYHGFRGILGWFDY